MTNSEISIRIYGVFEKWFTLPNTDVIDIVGGTVLGNRMPGVSLFLVLVASSGSGKSEIIESISEVKGVYPLNDLTPRTFLSGKMDEEGSLLLKIPQNKADPVPIFTVKDFTTIFEKRSEDRGEIMSQLREIYDGRYTKHFGGTKSKHWEGKIGLLAGVTGVYDEVSKRLSTLGERFLVYRPILPEPVQLAEKAQRGTVLDRTLKQELRDAMKGIDKMVIPHDVPVGYDSRKYLSVLCSFLATMRTPVIRHNYSRDIVSMPEPESTGRIAKQFNQLLRGVTVFRGRPEPGDGEMALIEKVAFSSVPSMRLKIIQTLPPEGASTRDVADVTRIPKSVVHREMEDLAVLGLIGGAADGWAPDPAYEVFWKLLRAC